MEEIVLSANWFQLQAASMGGQETSIITDYVLKVLHLMKKFYVLIERYR